MQSGRLAWIPYAAAFPAVLFVGMLVFMRGSSVFVPMMLGFAVWTVLYALAMELDIIRTEEETEAEAEAMRSITVEEMTERLARSDAILGQ